MTHLVMIVFGTRPEAIKMAPLILRMKNNSAIAVKVCVTGQHDEMLDQALDSFGLEVDENLLTMRKGQSLNGLACHLLETLDTLYQKNSPDVVVVHGDTTSSFMAAMAAFHHQIPIAHVEAGLRTGNLAAPWPEEANRRLTSVLADLHFAPTEAARENLLRENIAADKIHVTGNTVVDALLWMKSWLREADYQPDLDTGLGGLPAEARIILVTGHRRESLDGGLEAICGALVQLARRYPDDHIVYPVHLNPTVREVVQRRLENVDNIHLIAPLDYKSMIWLIDRSYLILTDSGGIQEEAPSLHKPVLIMRDQTERPEGLESGALKLVGLNEESIYQHACVLLDDTEAYRSMSAAVNPFGDGKACERIEAMIIAWLDRKSQGRNT